MVLETTPALHTSSLRLQPWVQKTLATHGGLRRTVTASAHGCQEGQEQEEEEEEGEGEEEDGVGALERAGNSEHFDFQARQRRIGNT